MLDAKYARDLILATIKEMQEEIGYYANFKKHQIYQEVYDRITEKYGDVCEDWKE
jgi:hypothetical protein